MACNPTALLPPPWFNFHRGAGGGGPTISLPEILFARHGEEGLLSFVVVVTSPDHEIDSPWSQDRLPKTLECNNTSGINSARSAQYNSLRYISNCCGESQCPRARLALVAYRGGDHARGRGGYLGTSDTERREAEVRRIQGVHAE